MLTREQLVAQGLTPEQVNIALSMTNQDIQLQYVNSLKSPTREGEVVVELPVAYGDIVPFSSAPRLKVTDDIPKGKFWIIEKVPSVMPTRNDPNFKLVILVIKHEKWAKPFGVSVNALKGQCAAKGVELLINGKINPDLWLHKPAGEEYSRLCD